MKSRSIIPDISRLYSHSGNLFTYESYLVSSLLKIPKYPSTKVNRSKCWRHVVFKVTSSKKYPTAGDSRCTLKSNNNKLVGHKAKKMETRGKQPKEAYSLPRNIVVKAKCADFLSTSRSHWRLCLYGWNSHRKQTVAINFLYEN